MAPHTAGAFFCHTNEMCDISATFTVQRCYTPTLLQSQQGLRKAIRLLGCTPPEGHAWQL